MKNQAWPHVPVTPVLGDMEAEGTLGLACDRPNQKPVTSRYGKRSCLVGTRVTEESKHTPLTSVCCGCVPAHTCAHTPHTHNLLKKRAAYESPETKWSSMNKEWHHCVLETMVSEHHTHSHKRNLRKH